jgi:hypothetical protein
MPKRTNATAGKTKLLNSFMVKTVHERGEA